MAIGRTNTGGGGTGATLVVTGVAGDTCTISKDGKSKTKIFDSNGTATFKGLATGAWTVTMQSASGSTATRTVAVNADYTLTIAYFSATINVTYSAGSTCTATDGSTTLTASDTSGSYTFTVPNAGTWTVIATNGTDTASKDVSITATGQIETVILSYALLLYDAGNEYIENTGGWESKRYCELTNTTTSLHAVPTARYSANAGVFATANKINLTEYNTLHYSAKNNAAENSYLQIAVWETIPMSGDPTAAAVAKASFSANEEKTGDIDVSKLSGEYYIGGSVAWGDTIKGDGYVYLIRLER